MWTNPVNDHKIQCTEIVWKSIFLIEEIDLRSVWEALPRLYVPAERKLFHVPISLDI